MGETICRYIDLPVKIRAVTVVDDDGNFNVYINAVLSIEEQKRALDHELAHIEKDHFYKKEKPVSECEAEARK